MSVCCVQVCKRHHGCQLSLIYRFSSVQWNYSMWGLKTFLRILWSKKTELLVVQRNFIMKIPYRPKMYIDQISFFSCLYPLYPPPFMPIFFLPLDFIYNRKKHDIYLCVIRLFHLSRPFLVNDINSHFLCPNKTPLCAYSTFLSIHVLLGT